MILTGLKGKEIGKHSTQMISQVAETLHLTAEPGADDPHRPSSILIFIKFHKNFTLYLACMHKNDYLP